MGLSWHIIAFCWLLLAGVTAKAENANCITTISQGTLVGAQMAALFATPFCAFLGVPFAQPPVESLRFRAPKEPNKWTGVLNATTKTKPCTGAFIPGKMSAVSEDCLYLNVYTPKLEPESNERFAVLVFFPGDSYLGDESFLYGPDYLMDKRIILVVVNYRVGPLGFLSTGSSVVPGNYGLKDQVRALRWVQENIRAFGGNPNKVTIYGHGVGGACVHYHILSPLSKGLFHRAISQSGSALNPNMRPDSNPILLVRKLGSKIKCLSTDDITLVSCLKVLDQTEFANITDINFGPAVELNSGHEEAFLPLHPLDIIVNRQINSVPWLMGTVSNEGAEAAIEVLQNKTALFKWNDNPDDVLETPSNLQLVNEANFTDGRWGHVLDFYLGKEDHNISIDKINAVMQLFGDRIYNFGMHMSAVLHALSGHTQIFKYNFAFCGISHYRKFTKEYLPYAGASHGDDLLYIFKLPMLEVFPPGQPEIEVIDKLTSVLSDFTNFGDPTFSNRLKVSWKPVGNINVNNIHVKYMNMSSASINSFEGLNLTMEEDLYRDRMDLWLSLLSAENVTFSKELEKIKNLANPVLTMPYLCSMVLSLILSIALL